MRFSFKKSLMVRLLAIFFLISFLPALVIGVATSELARVQNRNDIFSELQGINESKKIQIIQYIENTVQKALSLANQSEIVSLSQKVHSLMEQYPVDSEEFNAKVLEIQESYEQVMHNYHTTAGFAEINIISKDMGVLVFSEHAEKAILNSQGSEEEQELYSIWNDVRSSGTPTLYDFELDINTEEMKMHIAVPVYDTEGNFSDVLILGLPRDQINLITSFEFGQYETRESFLLSSEDRIISNPLYPEGSKVFGSIYDNKALSLVKEDDSFVDIIDAVIEDKRIFFATEKIHLDEIKNFNANFNWLLISQMDFQEHLSPINAQRLLILLFLFVVSLAAILIGYLIVRRIVTPLLMLNREVNRLAEGSLDISIESQREDEIGSLVNNTNSMIVSLSEIVKAIKTAAENANTTGAVIAVSAEQQSAISVEQAGSITEISTTMDEFTTSLTQVSENANAVSSMSETIFQHVSDSSSLINSVAEKIGFISEDNDRDIDNIMNLKQRSKDISKVMEIISNISDQTKIIAFNAALEASSAGEYGKRFGVVASEIRRLAENVISSAANIDTIISDIQKLADQMVVASEKTTKNINQGIESSKNSVSSMNSIVESIKSTHEATQQIALSVQQQQTAAAQIQAGLKEISIGAQQNSEAIQALSETGKDFKRVGQKLSILTRQFTLAEDDSSKT